MVLLWPANISYARPDRVTRLRGLEKFEYFSYFVEILGSDQESFQYISSFQGPSALNDTFWCIESFHIYSMPQQQKVPELVGLKYNVRYTISSLLHELIKPPLPPPSKNLQFFSINFFNHQIIDLHIKKKHIKFFRHTKILCEWGG